MTSGLDLAFWMSDIREPLTLTSATPSQSFIP